MWSVLFIILYPLNRLEIYSLICYNPSRPPVHAAFSWPFFFIVFENGSPKPKTPRVQLRQYSHDTFSIIHVFIMPLTPY
jgi:hypothetical protein